MADDLRILIQGSLDLKSTTAEINKQLKQLKINNLNLSVNVNTSHLNKTNEALRSIASNYELWWEKALQKQEKERERVLQSEHRTRVALEKRIEQDRERALQQEQKTRKAIEDQRIKEEQKIAKEREKALQAEQQIRRKIDQEQSRQLKVQQRNDFNVDNYKQQAQIKVQNLLTAYGNNVDKKQLQEFQNSVSKLTSSTPKLNQEIQKLNASFKQMEANARASANSLSGNFDHALSKILQWGAATTAVYGTVNALQSLIQTAIELDDQMTQLKRVMDDSTNFQGLFEGSIELSKELGQTLTNTNTALIEFARAGQSSAEALANARAVLLAMNVSELDAAEATKAVIVGRKVFNDELEDSVDLISRLNQVDNDFSTTTKDLALSLIKAGSTAKTFGADLNTLLGYTVAIQASTQESGNVVGNSLKTILSRLTTVSDSVSALQAVGISIKDMEGNLKPVSQVLTELSSKWNDLTEEQQQNIAISAAGRYQLNRFLALMQGMDVATKASASAANSQGSAMRENEKAMQSLTHQLNALQGAWQELVFVISDGGLNTGLSTAIKMVTGLIQGFTEFTRMTNGLNIAIPALALSLYGISKAFIAISAAAKTAELGVKGFKLSLGLIGVVLVGVEALVSAFISTSDAVTQSADDIHKFAEKTRNTSSDLQNLVQKYEELKSQASVNTDAQKELQQVMSDIQRIQPALVQSTDEYGNAIEINTQKANAYAESLKTMSIEQAKLAKATLEAQNAKLDLDITEAADDLKKIQDEHQSTYEQILAFQNKYKVKAIEDARAIVDAKQEEIEVIQKSGNADLYAQKRGELLSFVKELQAYEEQLSDIGDTEFLEAQKSLQTLEDKKKANNDQITTLDKIIFGNDKVKKSQDDLNNTFKNGIIDTEEFSDSLEEVNNTQDELFKQFDSTKKEVLSLNQVLDDLAEGKSITADEAAELILKEKELANAFTFENGQVKINQQAILELRNSKLKAFSDIANARAQDLANQQANLIKKLNNYGIEIKAIQSVADAQNALSGLDSRIRESRSITEAMEIEKTKRQVEGVKSEFEQIEALKKAISSPTFGKSKTPSSTKSPKTEYEALSSSAKRLLEIETQLEEVQARRAQLSSASQEYRDNIEKEKKLLQEKITLLQKEYDQVTKTQRIGGKSNKIGGSPKDSDEAFKRANELKQQIIQLQSQISSLSFDQVNSQFEEYAVKSAELSNHLDLSRTRMNLFRESSQEYTEELQFQIEVMDVLQQNIQDEINLVNKQLQLGNLTLAQKGELRQKLADLTKQQLDYKVSIEQTRRSIQGMIKDILEQQKQNHLAALQEKHEKAVSKLEKRIEDLNEDYDKQIEKQREKLELLDEEYEKEDRLLKLKEIDDQINKIKGVNDHDFVQEDGTLINTYDKERVSELEQEREELLRQYQREDVKRAIEDEITRLEEAKNKKIEFLQEELEHLKLKHEEEIKEAQKRWEGLIEAAEEGTLAFDELMHGEKGWYSKAINHLENYTDEVEDQFERLKSLYRSIASLKPPSGSSTPLPSVTHSPTGGSTTVKKYHDGGIVGDKAPNKLVQLANRLFNVKPHESLTKSLIGELQIPPKNIQSNLLPNLRNMAAALTTPMSNPSMVTENHFHFNNMTVKSDNPAQWLQGLNILIKSNKY